MKSKNNNVIAILIVQIIPASLLIFSCSFKKENVVVTCDTISSIMYTKDIKPILQDKCYSCHSTSIIQSNGGLDLEDYTSFKNYLTNNHYRGDTIFGSQFYNIVEQSFGVIPMPPGGEKLSTCDLAKLKRWIDKSAPNN